MTCDATSLFTLHVLASSRSVAFTSGGAQLVVRGQFTSDPPIVDLFQLQNFDFPYLNFTNLF